MQLQHPFLDRRQNLFRGYNNGLSLAANFRFFHENSVMLHCKKQQQFAQYYECELYISTVRRIPTACRNVAGCVSWEVRCTSPASSCFPQVPIKRAGSHFNMRTCSHSNALFPGQDGQVCTCPSRRALPWLASHGSAIHYRGNTDAPIRNSSTARAH